MRVLENFGIGLILRKSIRRIWLSLAKSRFVSPRFSFFFDLPYVLVVVGGGVVNTWPR